MDRTAREVRNKFGDVEAGRGRLSEVTKTGYFESLRKYFDVYHFQGVSAAYFNAHSCSNSAVKPVPLYTFCLLSQMCISTSYPQKEATP
jgi:hypothetical protein